MAQAKGTKAIMVVNDSDRDVTLFVSPTWQKYRFLSSSLIVEKGGMRLCKKKAVFRFELRAKTSSEKGEKMKTIFYARNWEKDLLLRVSGNVNLQVKAEELGECKEKQICLRRQNMAKEVSVGGGKNLYEILSLNMDDIRKKSPEEQNEEIKRAYHAAMLRWHPDKNPESGDAAICREIICAYKILKDPEARAAYNNVADFDKGWFSRARWKAMFRPECYSNEQKKQYRKRMILLGVSGFLTAGGVALSFATAGMAAPVVFGMTALTGALVGGGFSSALRTINRESVENGCSFRKYFTSLAIGAVGGAAIATGVAGITLALGGAAKVVFKAAQVSLERQITTRLATSTFRGFITSLTNRLDAMLVDGQKTTWKQFLLHILFYSWLAGISGAPGMCAESAIQDAVSVESTVVNLEEVASSYSKNVVESTVTNAVDTFAEVLKNRLDNDAENKPIVEHLKKCASDTAMAVGRHTAVAGSKIVKNVSEGGKETRISEESDKQNEATEDIHEETNDETKNVKNKTASVNKFVRTESEKEESFKINEYKDNTKGTGGTVEGKCTTSEYDDSTEGTGDTVEGKCTTSGYKDITEVTGDTVEGKYTTSEYNDSTKGTDDAVREVEGSNNETEVRKNDEVNHISMVLEFAREVNKREWGIGRKSREQDEATNAQRTRQPRYVRNVGETRDDDHVKNNVEYRVKYISEGSWFSRMIVDYKVHGRPKHLVVKGSESSIQIPNKATDIKVRFQVMRFIGTWCDVKKYDRFKRCWVKPNQPHVFEYKTPVNRTYTLAGNLYYEAVTEITEDYLDIGEI